MRHRPAPSCSTLSLNLVSRDLRTHEGTTSTPRQFHSSVAGMALLGPQEGILTSVRYGTFPMRQGWIHTWRASHAIRDLLYIMLRRWYGSYAVLNYRIYFLPFMLVLVPGHVKLSRAYIFPLLSNPVLNGARRLGFVQGLYVSRLVFDGLVQLTHDSYGGGRYYGRIIFPRRVGWSGMVLASRKVTANNFRLLISMVPGRN